MTHWFFSASPAERAVWAEVQRIAGCRRACAPCARECPCMDDARKVVRVTHDAGFADARPEPEVWR